MKSKLVFIIKSLKLPKIKKILLYEMKFLVRNYSCLQNPWLWGYRPQILVLSVLCPQLDLLNPPNKIPGYATVAKDFLNSSYSGKVEVLCSFNNLQSTSIGHLFFYSKIFILYYSLFLPFRNCPSQKALPHPMSCDSLYHSTSLFLPSTMLAFGVRWRVLSLMFSENELYEWKENTIT
jgi:hypothetical protein